VVASVPFPVSSPQQVTDALVRCVTPRTRLAVVDHITSATALVWPLPELLAELTVRGVETLIDGAHAAGQVPLSIPELGASFYTGSLHKWVNAPKGAGFLWVRPDRQPAIHPLAISHGANSARTDRSRFRLEFDWTGTADPSAHLAVPDAIRFGEELLPGGWEALRSRNHHLALEGRDIVCAALGVEPPAPDSMLGSMASIPLPGESGMGTVQGVDLYGDPVHDALDAQGLQVMITPWPQRPDGGPWRRLLRISAAAYNDSAQYRRLAAALPAALSAAAAQA
jgi:isopenicillin-N epimerase